MASVASELKFPPLQAGSKPPAPPSMPADPDAEAPEPFTLTALMSRLAGGSDKEVPTGVPVLRRLPFARQLEVLGILLVLFLLVTVATFAFVIWEARINRTQTAVSTELQMLSQRIAIVAEQSTRGNPDAFAQLNASRSEFASSLLALRQGGKKDGVSLPISSETALPILRQVGDLWKPIDENVRRILKQQQGLVQLKKSEEAIRKTTPQIRNLAQQLSVVVQERGEDVRAVSITLQLYADVTNYDFMEANNQLSTDQPSPQVALALAGNVNRFHRSVQSLVSGNKDLDLAPLRDPASRALAERLFKLVADFKTNVDSIVKNMTELAAAKQAYRDISRDSEPLLAGLDKLTGIYRSEGAGFGGVITGLLFAALTLASLALIAKVLLDNARLRAIHNEQANRRNEEAILRLLDDMSQLADGDLTRHAGVTEDMTGAIADSVNLAIDELRKLVTQINAAAGQLTESTNQGRSISGHLLQVAEKQAHEIQTATSSVLQMAATMNEVSENANQCAQVAEQSLSASDKGSTAVHDSISGMDNLREQIQETSKRIKRLGESSQEIGEIVQLIAGITEQTNVLALNAAIQAAAAGEAGRGFTVVAEEVQRLAERSGEATKQISAIVKTIQSDTHDAVVAMEKSTVSVVNGARLADSAGHTLAEIREVTQRLAQLIASISTATQSQLKAAQTVAHNMRDILNITTQTTKGTKWTADSMGQIADLAQKLKVSVSGFKV